MLVVAVVLSILSATTSVDEGLTSAAVEESFLNLTLAFEDSVVVVVRSGSLRRFFFLIAHAPELAASPAWSLF